MKAQILAAVSLSMLVAIVKKRLNLDASLYILLQIFFVGLVERIPLTMDFPDIAYSCEDDAFCYQLNLFDS